jgi:HK97 family phage prohead protease
VKHKSAPVTVGPDPVDGVFEAIVSVFGNKDLGGDIVRPGAFSKALKMWEASGDPIPVYWSHRMDDPTYNIGYVIEAKEIDGASAPMWANDAVRDNGGLYVKAQLDDYGMGAHVAKLLKSRRVRQFSFSYDVIDERKTAEGNELLELFPHEIGPTPLGMNPATELLSAKLREPPPEEDPPAAPAGRFFYARRKVAIDVQALLNTH